MSAELQVFLQLLNVLVLPMLYGGIRYIIRVETRLTEIQTKLGIKHE